MNYIIDLDGTLLNHTTANIDSIEFIREIQKRNEDFRIMSNSIKSPDVVRNRLRDAGMLVEREQIFNPIAVLNAFIKRENIADVYIVGTKVEIEQVSAKQEYEHPSLIALLDFEKNNCAYKDLQHIFELIQKGVRVVSASGSPYYAKEKKRYLDTGSFVNLFEAAADIKIPILGKPSKEYFSAVINSFQSQEDDILIIGDDWNTDMRGAENALCRGVLVKSGKYYPGDEKKCKPFMVVSKLMELFQT